MGDFVAAVLGNTEDTWREIFKAGGQTYTVPRLRLYSGVVQGGCGMAQAPTRATRSNQLNAGRTMPPW